MKENFDSIGWKKLMPETFAWLESLTLEQASAEPAKDHFRVVPVKFASSDANANAKNSDPVAEIDCPELAEDIAGKLKTQIASIGWTSGATTLIVDDAPFLVVKVSGVKTTASQIGRQAGLDASKVLKGRKLEGLVIYESNDVDGIDLFEGLALGLYDCKTFTGKGNSEKPSGLPGVVQVASKSFDNKRASAAISMGKATVLTRLLQDAPPNVMNSETLARICEEMAKDAGIECSVVGRSRIEELGMGAFAAVAAGTHTDPKLITLEIKGKDPSKTVALVGKGLTFDAGGISLKPGAGMHEMKYDMSGGAAVVGAALFLAEVQPPVNVACVIGAVENMPGSNATRPGDIVKAMNGKTIEILNTDAEGRLVLADVLHYAVETFKPALMLDIATLTGAVLHGLGCAGAAALTPDDSTADYLANSSRKTGEPFWRLPLWPENGKEVKGEFSDLKNIASPAVKGGTIIGGVFLKEFVGDTKWAHLDVAGTAWSCRATGYPSNGGSAYGLRTMGQACLDFTEFE